MKFDKERRTESVFNIIYCDAAALDEYREQMLHRYYSKIKNHKHVEAHKAMFGRQSYCWTGEYRYYVWDFGKWRVYVSNQMGVAIEVEPEMSLKETMAILRNYWTKIGV